MNVGKPDAVFIDTDGVINTEFPTEEFFQGHMEVMQKTGIINNAGMINIAETNFLKENEKACFNHFDTKRSTLVSDNYFQAL